MAQKAKKLVGDMRVLCLYPAMDIRFNDNAYALIYLMEKGVKLSVICSKLCDLKSEEQSPEYEEMKGIPIYRMYKDFSEQSSYPIKSYNQIYDIAKQFHPDVLFCSQQLNMDIACKLKNDFDIPIVLLVEFAYEPLKLVKRRWYLGMKPLARPVANLYWRWLSKNTRAIITSYVGDRKYLKHLSRYGTPVYYIPWCNHIPDEVATRQGKKEPLRCIYVGSLSKWKNTDEFSISVPIIFDRTPVQEFVIVGPDSGNNVVKRLKMQYGERIKYFESLPRIQALKLIQDSFFSYTPVKTGGWGFIGDSWGVKTPLVVTHNEYELRNKTDSLIVDRVDNIHLFINQLYESPELYQKLQTGGFERYQRDHTARSVGDKLLNVFNQAMVVKTPGSEQ